MSVRVTSQARISLLAWMATVLASISLFPLFAEKDYVVSGAVAAFVVAAVGIGLRALGVPAVLVVVAQIAAVVEWAVLTRASGEAAYAVIPTPDAIEQILGLVSSGAQAAATYAAPVPSDEGLLLLVTLGIAATAILVDLITVGLRQVAWAGLPLLALYTVPVATVPNGVPALAFLPGALGFVALLSAEERDRVSRWGKQITRAGQLWGGTAREQISTAALAQTGRRIGFTAVALAIVVPVFLPAFPEHLFTSGIGTGGAGPIGISNPMVDLKQDLVRGPDTNVVSVQTDADPSYLRLTALDDFTGISWQPSVRDIPPDHQASQGLPPPPGLQGSVRRTPRSYDIEVTEHFNSTWLPEYYPATSVGVEGDWRYDERNLDIVSADEDLTTEGLRYEGESLSVEPTVQQLNTAGLPPPAVRRFYTKLPADLPSEVGQQAEQVIVDARAETDFERAVALQEWFRSEGGFIYSTKAPPGNSTDFLVDFLTVERTGYCEQFAAAMALLARTLDIPSRVAVGFLKPKQVDDDRFVFSTHDLHTWPELYFEGVGWVRFEPTPADRTGQPPDYTQAFGGNDPINPDDPEAGALGGRDPDTLEQATDPPEPTRTPDKAPATARSGSGGTPWSVLGLALVAFLLVAPAVARATLRRWRWQQARTATELAEAAWTELRDTARDLGTGWAGSLTPRGTARVLKPHLHGDSAAEQALTRLVTFVERARYARTAGSHPDAKADVAAVTSALRAGVGRWARWRGALAPASVLPDFSAAWDRVTLPLAPERRDAGAFRN